MTISEGWWRRQTPTLVNLSTVLVSVGQNLVFTALIARHWSAQALGQWLSLEASISLLLALPAVLADLVGFELLKALNPVQRHGLYRQGTLAACVLTLLLLPATTLLLFGQFPLRPIELIAYAAVRLLGHPVLGTMSKRLYSDGHLSLSFSLGSLDQLLLLAPAALVALAGGSFAQAVAWAGLLRGLQVTGQGLLLQHYFPWGGAAVDTGWTVSRLWRRMLLLAPASLPAPLIQNGITLMTATLLGQAQLAVFSTHRTAAGFLGQFGNALIEPRIPGMLRQSQRLVAAWALVRRSLPFVVAALPLLLIIFPVLYPLWLGTAWRPHFWLFLVLLMVQLFRFLQQPFATLIRSLNEPISSLIEGWSPFVLVYSLLLILHPEQLLPFAMILLASEVLQLPLRLFILRRRASTAT